MKILIAPDKFKDALTAEKVCNSIAKGIMQASPNFELWQIVLSDGGDGFLLALEFNNRTLEKCNVTTVNASGKKIDSYFLIERQSDSAFIELASASGLAELKENERNGLITSTYGTGIEIESAIKKGFKNIYIGLGGSATNDGGCGIAAALGYRFLDKNNIEFIPKALSLINIEKIIRTDLDISGHKFFAINDVNNPLLGREGATYTYGIQKGLKASDLQKVEDGMTNLNQKVIECLDKDSADIPGSGAAGGAAFGLKVFFDAEYISGIDFFLQNNSVIKSLNLKEFDLIITGEGKIDNQTKHGKLISGISRLGQEHAIPVVAFCGKSELSYAEQKYLNLKEIIEVGDRTKDLNFNLNNSDIQLQKHAFLFIKKWIQKN